MRYNKIFSVLGLLAASLVKVNASRGDFYGENDNRPEIFKILDDHIASIKINFDDETWATMKEKTHLEPWDAGKHGEKYGTENATMEFTVEGTDYRVDLQPGDFKFYLAGKGSRNFVKPNYNIKLSKGKLFDLKLLRLRSNIRDATLMREKLSSDLLYKMGIKATSTNYAKVEVNGEYLGLYILTNKVKKDFMKKYFNDEELTTLYECKDDRIRFEDNTVAEKCINVNEDLVDYKDEIKSLNDAVNNAKTIDDIKDIIDVDAVLRSFAFEFVTISWDHFFLQGHNFFWYKKPEDGKWMIILNDFDETFAQDIYPNYYTDESRYVEKNYIPDIETINLPNLSVRDMDTGHKLVKLLILDDDTRWREILGEVVKTAFNPDVLYPRIDEIADLIHDEIAVSRGIVEETGKAHGCFNILGQDPGWNITQFEDTINFTNWISTQGSAISYGLKFFIQERLRYICHTYAIDPKTLELIEPRPVVSFWGIKLKNRVTTYGSEHLGWGAPHIKFEYPELEKEQYMQEEYNANAEKNKEPSEYHYLPTIHEQNNSEQEQTVTEQPTEPAETTNTTESAETCWSEKLDYPCCTSTCYVYSTDEDGEWGYEDNHWCGVPASCSQDQCWSTKLGYGCCEGCHTYEVDDNGKWGYENGKWCGIVEDKCQ